MARLVFAMNQSLDGYVDHDRFAPDPVLFRHWIEAVGEAEGGLYGRGIYNLMRYWETDDPGWSQDEHDFATAWRAHPKWVVSRSLTEVGPGATLISDEAEAAVRRLKDEVRGQIDVGGPVLAGWLAGLGLIDEYRLYVHPVVLGQGGALLRRCPAGAAPCRKRPDQSPGGPADLRSGLIRPPPPGRSRPLPRVFPVKTLQKGLARAPAQAGLVPAVVRAEAVLPPGAPVPIARAAPVLPTDARAPFAGAIARPGTAGHLRRRTGSARTRNGDGPPR